MYECNIFDLIIYDTYSYHECIQELTQLRMMLDNRSGHVILNDNLITSQQLKLAQDTIKNLKVCKNHLFFILSLQLCEFVTIVTYI